MKLLSVLYFLALTISGVYPQNNKHPKYEKLVSLPPAALIEKGNFFQNKNQEDTPLMFYLVLSPNIMNRWTRLNNIYAL